MLCEKKSRNELVLDMIMADIKYIDLKDNDSVEFQLFPDLSRCVEDGKNIFTVIDELTGKINKIVKELSENYIWHNEEFRVSPKNLVSSLERKGIGSEPFSFYGTLNYGENIDDEWFAVFLLVELTKEIEGLVVSVKDGDGEFLLIEAAEQLPSWITRETSEGKTFLYKGAVHVLPLSFKTENATVAVTEEVLRYVREKSDKTKCDDNVQKTIRARISEFSEKADVNYHNAIVFVPVGVASLLNINEKFIAPAIRAFCERDLLDVKACRAMKYFPPENRVYTQVKFTKLLYVMLASSKYIPDKRTGWNLPKPSDEDYKSQLLGIKLACGFEILVNQARNETSKGDTEEIDFSNDPNWKKFLKCLKARNYFRGLLEHSKQYTQLLESAKEYYSNSCGKSLQPNRAKEILDTLNRMEIDMEELKKKEANLPKSDDDSWMNITEEELDELLKVRFGCGRDESGHDGFEISHHLKDFINHTSGIEGAEFPKKCKTNKNIQKTRSNKKRKVVKFSPDTKPSDAPSEAAAHAGTINFEADGFINAIKNILDFSIPDDNYWENEGSGMSSYEDEPDLEVAEKAKSSSEEKDTVLIQYMKEMDKELSRTTMAQSFVTKKVDEDNRECNFEDAEELKPVDIDVNALKNIISSYRAQMGEPGPAENLLGPFGVKLDDIEADVE